MGLAISTVEKLTDDWEVIIVDDGSRKEDREALEMIINATMRQCNNETMKNRIKIIHHQKNKGYGGALRTGFTQAKKDLIFYTDCDAQYDPRELTNLYKAMEPSNAFATAGKVGMVNGYKIKRNDPWFRILAGRVYHYIVKFSFGLPIRDTDCDFRLIRREVFNPSASSGRPSADDSGRVRLFEDTGTICVELVKKINHAGYTIVEVPVHHFWRTSGKSQFFNFGGLAKTGINLAKLWYKLIIQKEYHQ